MAVGMLFECGHLQLVHPRYEPAGEVCKACAGKKGTS
jgi:hypothetical protein